MGRQNMPIDTSKVIWDDKPDPSVIATSDLSKVKWDNKAEVKAPATTASGLVGNTLWKGLTRPLSGVVDVAEGVINKAYENITDPRVTGGPARKEPLPPPIAPGTSFGGTPSMEKGMMSTGVMRPEGVPQTEWGKKAQDLAADIGPMVATAGAGALYGGYKGVRGLLGLDASAARKAASEELSGAIGNRAGALEREAGSLVGEKANLEIAGMGNQSELARHKAPHEYTSNETIGNAIRTGVTEPLKEARTTRAQYGERAYPMVEQLGVAKDATEGTRADISGALSEAEAFYEKVKDIPEIGPKARSMFKALGGKTKDELSVSAPTHWDISSTSQAPPAVVAPAPKGVEFDKLLSAARYFKDIAYGGQLEGFGSEATALAKKIVKKLDPAIEAYVPESKAVNAKYRELSKPLDVAGTKYGKMIEGMEGSIKGNAYYKVSPEELPGKLLKSSNGREQLVDVIAGGKEASAEAKLAPKSMSTISPPGGYMRRFVKRTLWAKEKNWPPRMFRP
jgi:hypothetical protein